MTASLNGGSVRVLWDADDTAEVTITGSGSAVWTVNGSTVTFPYTLSSSTTFETTHAGSYDVSVEHHGYEVASTPDGTRNVELRFGEQAIFSPTPDGTPNNKFMADLHGSIATTVEAEVETEAPRVVPRVTARQLLSAKTKHDAAAPPKAMVSFIDDDGRTEAYTILRPIFNTQGEKFCPAIVSDWMGDATFMSVAQIQTLATEGHEIMSHGHTHTQLATMTAAQWDQELGGSKAILEDTLGLEVNSFVYPGGSLNDGVVDVISSHYDSAWTQAFANNKIGTNPLDQYRGKRRDLDNDTLATAKSHVDAAVASGGWVVFTIHSWYAQWATAGKQQDLNDLIDYIQSLSVPIVTIAQGLEKHGNVLDYGEWGGARNYLKIEKSGRIKNRHNRWFSEPANTVLPTNRPDFFHNNAVTITHHDSTTTATGFPGTQLGTLITTRGLQNQTEQQWIPYSSPQQPMRLRTYRRTNSSESAWNAWIAPYLSVTTTSIPALAIGATTDITVDISALGLTRLDSVALNYRTSGGPPAGLTWPAYWLVAASDTAVVTDLKIRLQAVGTAVSAQPLYFSIVPIVG